MRKGSKFFTFANLIPPCDEKEKNFRKGCLAYSLAAGIGYFVVGLVFPTICGVGWHPDKIWKTFSNGGNLLFRFLWQFRQRGGEVLRTKKRNKQARSNGIATDG